MKIVFVDVRNLSYAIRGKFGPNRQYDFRKVPAADRRIAVGLSDKDKGTNENFINLLRGYGFETNFKKSSYVMGDKILERTMQNEECTILLVSEIVRVLPVLTHAIICTQNKSLIPFLKLLKAKGIYVEVMSAGLPNEMRWISDAWSEVMVPDLKDPTLVP